MPSKSKKQAKLMRAVAHGWKPSRIKGPTRAVAKEFVSADKRRDEVTGYQFGGPAGPGGWMQNYRGVPPQRGQVQRGPTGTMGGRMPGRGGYGHAGGVPGTIGGFGGYQGQGRSPFGGGRGPMPPRRRPQQDTNPYGLSDWERGENERYGPAGRARGALQQYMQQRGGEQGGGNIGGGPSPPYMPTGGGAPGGGGSVLSRFVQQANQQRGGAPGGGQRMYGGRPTPGLHDTQDMLMGEGPGGRLEQEGMRRQAKMRGPGRFGGGPGGGPGGGALSQFGGKRAPGRRIAPPPGKFPGGGHPNLRGRNPMMRAARNRSGRGATSFLR